MALPARHGNGNTQASRRSPLDQLNRLRHLAGDADPWGQLPSLIEGVFTPLADLEETDDAYAVELELAGVNREDLDIEVAGPRLTVSGERKEKERVGILRRRERVVGRFHYEVNLPGEVDEDGVEAHLDDGVLTIHIPKSAAERPRRIPIQ